MGYHLDWLDKLYCPIHNLNGMDHYFVCVSVSFTNKEMRAVKLKRGSGTNDQGLLWL